jgi:hypothetical protein
MLEPKNLIGKPKPPAFSAGDKVGQLTVVEYIGKTSDNLAFPHRHQLSRSRHWYRVQCTCGNMETVHQDTINPSGRHQCAECSKKEGARRRAKRSATIPAGPVADFARVRW